MSTRTPLPFLARPTRVLALLALVSGLLASGCASSGGGSQSTRSASPNAAGEPLRVTLHDYLGKGQSFEIVGESTTDRVAYLSSERSAANRKFLPDDVLAAFIDYLEEEGMGSYGQAGRAPSSGGSVITRAFEIERGGSTTCWPVGAGTEKKEKLSFTVLMTEFLQVYTEIPAFQAIENPEGHELFRDSGRQKTGR